jgi:hydroxypyruvate reductase
MTTRNVLLSCLRAALAAADGRCAVRTELARRPLHGHWHLVAIGKAAAAMAQGAVDALGTQVAGGVIVIPAGHVPPGFDPAAHDLAVCYGSHPLPDQASLAAGAAVVDVISRLPADAQLLFLVSGGASSLVDCLRPGVSLDDLQALNRWALQSGAGIAQINGLRRRISRLKGGGLARLASGRRLQALMISDVPGDDPRILGSGLLHASPIALGDVPGGTQPPTTVVPSELREFLDRVHSDPDKGDDVPRVPFRIVASLGSACRAAAASASAQGLKARIVRTRVEGDAAALGVRCIAALARQSAGVVQVRGGESTVRLPEHPGRGGRNQHLALAAALELERRGLHDASLLAVGTDGIDGASGDAGACVDADTCQRGRDAGCDPSASLVGADSGTFLEAAGDLLHTGPTLTNVGDLVLGLRLGGHR